MKKTTKDKKVVHIEHEDNYCGRPAFLVKKSFNGVISDPANVLVLRYFAYSKDFHLYVKEWLEEGYTIEIK